MYTCVRAIVCPRGINTRFSERQVGNEVARQLLEQNKTVSLILTHPAISHEVSLDLMSVENLIYSVQPDITINQWLTSLGNATLPTSDVIPKVTAATIKYNDAFAAGFKLQRVHPLLSPDSQLPEADLTDILMTKSDMDYKKFFDNVLVTVNGLLHLTDASTAGIKIKGAGASSMRSNRHNIGLISFLDVGQVTCIPFTEDMIKPRVNNRLQDGITVSVPGVDLTEKVVMLSLGGFLQYGNSHYRVTGETSLAIDWRNIPFAHRYMQSKKLIDVTPFEDTLTRNINHGDNLDLNQALSDESIKAYLTLSQSFIILVDCDNFYTQLHQLEKTGLPGRYYSYDRPYLPLLVESGLLPAYVAMPEADMYSVCVEENMVKRFASDTRPIAVDNYFADALISQNKQYYSAGYFLELGNEVLDTGTA